MKYCPVALLLIVTLLSTPGCGSKNQSKNDSGFLSIADSLREMEYRTLYDFSLTGTQIDSILEAKNILFTPSEREEWENKGWLEYRIINGRKMYFNKAVSNLLLVKSFHLNRSERDSAQARDPRIMFRKGHTASVIRAAGASSSPVLPVNIEVVYTITVKPDVVPPGEIIRCWLPYPKENNKRHSDVFLLGISNENNFLLAPDSAVHRSIYMEEKARKGEPTVFKIAFSYTSYGQYFEPAGIKILPYNKNSDLYKMYTREEPPHINFNEDVRKIADSLAGDETDPYKILKKFYYWFSNNIPWAGAMEYSIMADIPAYTIKNMKGDCGMQTFLLMSMMRYKGIPVKWQSGWMVPPQAENLHDWCEVWFEGTGWVPVDISYGLQYTSDTRLKEFYITGIDAYRMIVNDGIAGELYPQKKFFRSEPFDFQRGEVEWSGGNLYFDKWDYDISITYGQSRN